MRTRGSSTCVHGEPTDLSAATHPWLQQLMISCALPRYTQMQSPNRKPMSAESQDISTDNICSNLDKEDAQILNLI
jgi:hypothetical protein